MTEALGLGLAFASPPKRLSVGLVLVGALHRGVDRSLRERGASNPARQSRPDVFDIDFWQ